MSGCVIGGVVSVCVCVGGGVGALYIIVYKFSK